MATVVVSFAATPATSSTPVPRSLRSSSVCSGRISLTEPTMVVLPAPNPPAIRILVVTGGRAPKPGPAAARSERAESIEHLPQHPGRGPPALGRARLVHHRDEPLVPQVAEQH